MTFPSQTTILGKPDAVITVNTAEADERIKAKAETVGLFDPLQQAKSLDLAVRRGLASAVIDANMDVQKGKIALRYYGIFGALGAFSASPPRTALVGLALGPILWNANIARSVYENNLLNDQKVGLRDIFGQVRQSVLVGLTLDRVVAANATIAAHRLIKARK